jgi:uncharacterized protein YodC (DUF2158 family)
MADAFQIGDTVRLKSGGPRMTVHHVGRDAASGAPSVTCKWFFGSDPKQADFHPDTLEIATDGGP